MDAKLPGELDKSVRKGGLISFAPVALSAPPLHLQSAFVKKSSVPPDLTYAEDPSTHHANVAETLASHHVPGALSLQAPLNSYPPPARAPSQLVVQELIKKCFIDPKKLKRIAALGQGAFASVEKAELIKDGNTTKVAVKRLLPEVVSSAAELENFCHEADLLQKMNHSAVVQFIGIGYTNPASLQTIQETLYLVQEYMEGGTLKKVVEQQMICNPRRFYTNTDALRWMISVAEGLNYLHTRSPMVIHRDLKLENILLKGKDIHTADAKICDFGLMRYIDKARMQRLGSHTTLASTMSGDPPSDEIVMSNSRARTVLQGSASEGEAPLKEQHSSSPLPPRHKGPRTVNSDPDKGPRTVNSDPAKTGRDSKDSNNSKDDSMRSGTGALAALQRGYSLSRQHSLTRVGTPLQALRAPVQFLRSMTMDRDKKAKLDAVMRETTYRLTGQTGSLMYMAPEVYRNEKYNHLADVFSFGVILYEVTHRTMVLATISNTGQPSEVEAYAKSVSEGHRPKLYDRLPPALLALIKDCMAQDPSQRPNMAEVVERLRKLQHDGDMQHMDDLAAQAESVCGCFGCGVVPQSKASASSQSSSGTL